METVFLSTTTWRRTGRRISIFKSKEKEDKRISQTGFLKKRKKGPAGVAQ